MPNVLPYCRLAQRAAARDNEADGERTGNTGEDSSGSEDNAEEENEEDEDKEAASPTTLLLKDPKAYLWQPRPGWGRSSTKQRK